MPRQVRDAGAPELVLAWHAGDRGTGPADPTSLHYGNSMSAAREMPCQLLAALAAAKDHRVEVFHAAQLKPAGSRGSIPERMILAAYCREGASKNNIGGCIFELLAA
jgi:hypothetical protein